MIVFPIFYFSVLVRDLVILIVFVCVCVCCAYQLCVSSSFLFNNGPTLGNTMRKSSKDGGEQVRKRIESIEASNQFKTHTHTHSKNTHFPVIVAQRLLPSTIVHKLHFGYPHWKTLIPNGLLQTPLGESKKKSETRRHNPLSLFSSLVLLYSLRFTRCSVHIFKRT